MISDGCKVFLLFSLLVTAAPQLAFSAEKSQQINQSEVVVFLWN